MAKEWITLVPLSGTGQAEVKVTVPAHTGRLVRQCTITARSAGGATAAVRARQEAHEEFVTIVSGNGATVPAKGGSVVITGKSNSATLLLAGEKTIGQDYFPSDTAFKLEVNGTVITQKTDEQAAVPGDPGASEEYIWKLTLTLPENQSLNNQEGILIPVLPTDLNNYDERNCVMLVQEAGSKSYGEVNVISLTYPDIPAAGGDVRPAVKYSQSWGWNGNTTNGGTLTSGAEVSYTGTGVNAASGQVSGSSLGVTEKGRTKKTSSTVTVRMNGKSATKSADIYQEANTPSYGAVTVSGGSVSDIPASGGSASAASGLSASQTVSYTSRKTRPGTVSVKYSTAIQGDNLGTTAKARTKLGTLTATATGEGSKSAAKQFDVYQEANTPSYGAVTVSGGTVPDILASGGKVSAASGLSASQTVSYTSGKTRPGTVSVKYSTAIQGDNLGTTLKVRTKLGTLTATATGEGSKSAVKSFDVYQQANEWTSLSDPIFTVPSAVTLRKVGGNHLIEPVWYKLKFTYTSGASETSEDNMPGNSECSVVTSCSGFSLNDHTVKVTANDTIKARGPFVVKVLCETGLSKYRRDITHYSYNMTFSQEKGDSTISVNIGTLEFVVSGGSKAFSLRSNDSWSLEKS